MRRRSEMKHRRGEIRRPASVAVKSASTTCSATTRKGKPCPSRATVGAYCYWHSPDVTEAEKTAARRRGWAGAKRARMPLKFTPADFATEEGCRSMLEEAANLLRSGRLGVGACNALAKLAAVGLKASEIKIAGEIRALQAQMNESSGSSRRRRS
jgi:hypothetical protein